MKHDYIINIKAVGRGLYNKLDGSKPEDILFIIMDFASEGEIFDIISNTGPFSEEIARYYFI
jgi:serine/threonine protein kinase